ncbi:MULTISPECIES: TetR/AcrR family transcriptional regulator [Nocardiaceae]|uniref:TetR/AcrR family transcriptional regulator n=1 Tax=Nocardiaceae TaxID=85025 RepID=UPI000691D895|nr:MULTISPECIES: TetR/AcrR family transcriptional regulator [Rhodococcus]
MDGRRGTKQTNRDKIIGAAISAYESDPDATIGDIADAAGVVRRTVYGHFPSRRDLIIGIADQASDDLIRRLSGVADIVDDPILALATLELATWPVGNRYRTLLGVGRRELGEGRIRELLDPARRTTVTVVEQGQLSGRFSTELTPATFVVVAEAATLALLDRMNVGDDQIDGYTAATVTLTLAGVDASTRQKSIELAQRRLDGIGSETM